MDFTGPLPGKWEDPMRKPAHVDAGLGPLWPERDGRATADLKHSPHHYRNVLVWLFAKLTFKPGLLHRGTLTFSLCRQPGPKTALQLIKT